MATELGHAHLSADASSRAGLLEDHANGLTQQGLKLRCKTGRLRTVPLLQLCCSRQQLSNLCGREVLEGQEMAPTQVYGRPLKVHVTRYINRGFQCK